MRFLVLDSMILNYKSNFSKFFFLKAFFIIDTLVKTLSINFSFLSLGSIIKVSKKIKHKFKLKSYPGPVRPALPALCDAFAWLILFIKCLISN